ncbi:MAG: dephospho-CoA kinase, partial [Paucibacter sp.]|nr:dephospho-CoA kinase [Roseateles sp.]
IGSGKSTVAQILSEAGATVIDTDAIARALSAPGGAAIPALRDCFGPAAIDASGALDRAYMRELAFRDTEARQKLEAILHPLISAQTQEQARAATTPIVVFDVPLLVESGTWRQRVDFVLVIDREEQTQIECVMQRSGWTREAVQAVLNQQASRAERRAAADAVILNEGKSLATLKSEVLALMAQWQTRTP